MSEIVAILRYLLQRVPMSTQAEHDAIAVLIDGLEAAIGQTETNGGTQP
jgi:hypothetical protein